MKRLYTLIFCFLYISVFSQTKDSCKVSLGEDILTCLTMNKGVTVKTPLTGASFSWSGTTSINNCNNCNTFIPENTKAGIFTIIVTAKSGKCEVSDTLQYEVSSKAAPKALFIPDPTLCKNQKISLGSNANSNLLTYKWSVENGVFNSKSNNPEITPQESGSYFVSVTNGECPVPLLDTITVTVFDFSNIGIPKGDTIVCIGKPVLVCKDKPQTGASYSWSPSTFVQNPKDLNTTITPPTNMTYFLEVKAGFCKVSYIIQLKVVDLHILLSTPDTMTVCENDEVKLALKSSTGVGTLTWNINGKNIPQNNNIGSYKFSPATSSNVEVRFQNGGCIASDYTYVKVLETANNLKIQGDTFACKGATVKLSPNITGSNISFDWALKPAIPFVKNGNSIEFVADQNVQVKLVAKNGICEKVVSQVISIGKVNNIAVQSSKSEICSGETVEITVTGNDNNYVNWTPSTVKKLDSLGTKIIVSPTENTVYTVKNSNGSVCDASGTIEIKVNPTPSITYPGKTEFCIGEKLDTMVLNTTPDVNTLYTWQSKDDITFQTSNEAAPKIKPYKSAIYTVKMKNGVCEATDQVTVKVLDGYINVSDKMTVCPKTQVALSFNTSLNTNKEIEKYEWISGGKVVEYKFIAEATKTYFLKINYTVGNLVCNYLDSVKVIVKDTPKGEILATPSIEDCLLIGQDYTFSASVGGTSPLKDYSWIVNGETKSLKEKLDQTILGMTKISLNVSNQAGCSSTIDLKKEICVKYPSEPVFPKVFIPADAETDNQTFKAYMKDKNLVSIEKLNIFNRWGNQVYTFTSSDSQRYPSWDGKLNGNEELPADTYTYFYEIKFKDGKTVKKAGEVTIVR